ncbi:hypothetical protein ON010_g16543 [Phytophthora cinnamomi]|nr:hypothetical protein ON010_g16543 [Phytophthora cinnamomi]
MQQPGFAVDSALGLCYSYERTQLIRQASIQQNTDNTMRKAGRSTEPTHQIRQEKDPPKAAQHARGGA